MSRIWLLLFIFLSFRFISAEAQVFQEDFQPPYYEENDAPSEFSSSTARGPEFFLSSSEQDLNVSAVLPDYPWVRVSKFRGFEHEKCLSCHLGIEEISHSHPMSFGCTVCHGGEGNSEKKETAHSTLIYQPRSSGRKGNPSRLAVAEKSCGQLYCHEGHEREDRNIVSRVSKSLMGTLAGVISGLRYQWAGQTNRNAKYGVYSIVDQDGWIPKNWGGLEKLSALPLLARHSGRLELDALEENRPVFRHIGDRILRTKCFGCHLDNPGDSKITRGTGCAACHIAYGSKGLYEGGDPTISDLSGPHPKRHKIEALPSNETCVKCHTLYRHFLKEDDAESQAKPTLLFPGTGQPIWDVHLEKGFDCIDCHTAADIMGDGNIYSKQHQAVEIRCISCHGTSDAKPQVEELIDSSDAAVRRSRYYKGFYNVAGDLLAVSAKGRKLSNVKILEDRLVTLGKRSGKQFEIPMTADSRWAHSFPGHKGKLECTACHSQWVPRCQGCHVVLDQSMSSPDFGKNNEAPSITWGKPVLMVGPKGKAAPMMARDPRPLTLLDEAGKPIMALNVNGDAIGVYLERPFINPRGFSGTNLAYAANPHSINRSVRICADCHLNPPALGFGRGALTLGRENVGREDLWEPTALQKENLSNNADEAKVTPSGNPLTGINQTGARPFNQEELTRILKVGNCIACHDRYRDKIYQNMKESYRFEKTQPHRKLRMRILSRQ